jgi:ABC-type sugar transport system ATPase subunit
MTTPLLTINHLSKTFPGLKALDDVSLTVSRGEIVALLGQNGSGKSTLVKVLAGVHQPDPLSEVSLADGHDGQASLHFIHQDLGLVGSLSTIENLSLDRELGSGALRPNARRAEREHAEALVAAYGGNFDVTARIDTLAAAERTIVAIARAMDGWEHPNNVLVLDEPTASLHGDEAERLFVAVRRVAQRGAGVIFISHRLGEVIELADRVVVLRDGRLIADVPRGGYDHDDLVEMIAGTMVPDAVDLGRRRLGDPVLRARGIRGATIADLALAVRAGEIVGVSGVLGSGREDVSAILFGAGQGSVEHLEVGGEAVIGRTPRRAVDAGLAFVPANRREHGAVMKMSARENLTLPRLAPLRRMFGRLDQAEEKRDVQRWVERVGVRPAEPEQALDLFSGGNQQKVVLAKWLRNEPKVLLLDEPTQGVDVGAKAGIYDLIGHAAARGAGVLVCSSDAEELALICDRVLVMSDGVLVSELERRELSEARLIRAGIGRVGASTSGTAAQSDTEVPNHA